MSHEVLFPVQVGCVNFLFRYLPLRIRVGQPRPGKHGATGVLLDTIGIASICTLRVVSCIAETIIDSRRLLPTLIGLAVPGLSFCLWKTRSINFPTLLSALAYGIVWKVLADA